MNDINKCAVNNKYVGDNDSVDVLVLNISTFQKTLKKCELKFHYLPCIFVKSFGKISNFLPLIQIVHTYYKVYLLFYGLK